MRSDRCSWRTPSRYSPIRIRSDCADKRDATHRLHIRDRSGRSSTPSRGQSGSRVFAFQHLTKMKLSPVYHYYITWRRAVKGAEKICRNLSQMPQKVPAAIYKIVISTHDNWKQSHLFQLFRIFCEEFFMKNKKNLAEIPSFLIELSARCGIINMI